MSVGALGTGSGMDLESLVSGLVSSQRDSKIAAYEQKISDLSVELSAVGSAESVAFSFHEAVKKVNDPRLFNSRIADIEQPSTGDAVAIEASGRARNGQYNVGVNQVASGSRMELLPNVFESPDEVLTALGGTMTFAAGNESFTINLEGGTTLAELSGIIAQAEKNFGVSASIIDTGEGDVRLIIESDKTGDGNDLTISSYEKTLVDIMGTDTRYDFATLPEKYTDLLKSTKNNLSMVPDNLISTQFSQNGIINVDGVEIQGENNTFDKAVQGLEIEALNKTEGQVAASISTDSETIKESIRTLTDSYNKMVSTFNDLTQMGGTLQGNSLLRNLESSLVTTLGRTFEGDGEFRTMFDLGLEVERNGLIKVDSYKLDNAISSGFRNFADMFTGERGIAKAFDELMQPYMGASGLFRSTEDSIQSQITSNDESREAFDLRMEQYEKTLRKQYSSLDSSIAEMNASGAYLRSQLAGLE